MSTFRKLAQKCGVCGNVGEYTVWMSTNSFGSSDLDLRPPGMRRDTMHTWVQECPHCGYAASDIREKLQVSKEILSTDKYVTCGGMAMNGQASKFYRAHLIDMEKGDLNSASYHILCAAWACDDARDTVNAANCRRIFLEIFEKRRESEPMNDTQKVQRADIMRRVGLFDRVVEEYSPDDFGEEILKKAVAFQIEKAKAKDIRRYTVADALGE